MGTFVIASVAAVLAACPDFNAGKNELYALIADAGPDQSAVVGEIVCFSAAASRTKDGIASASWDFGDGCASGNSALTAAEHVYENPGTYIVTLTLHDRKGRSDWDTCIVTVDPNPPPVCAITEPEKNTLLTGAVAIRGTASDDEQVVSVEVRVNDGDWQAADSSDGFATWSIEVEILETYDAFTGRSFRQVPFIAARAYDSRGQYSEEAALNRDFANAVVSYIPAPGQFVNTEVFSNPEKALGSPYGATDTGSGDTSKVVTLGAFGGCLTVRFYEPITAGEENPLGMDFIAFGNPFAVTGSDMRWQEPGIIEVSEDANGNGLPDDKWYLIPGSHLEKPFVKTGKTYARAIDANYPSAAKYPLYPIEATLYAYKLPDELGGASALRTSGYVDSNPVVTGAGRSANTPDDPNTPEIESGSMGGDAVSLLSAVDPDTGEKVEIARIHFIRVTCAVDKSEGMYGEISTEVSGFGRVNPPDDGSGAE